MHCGCLQTHQKWASNPITDDCEPPCGCWDLNSGSLTVLLTTESSLRPQLIHSYLLVQSSNPSGLWNST